jgi:hypothetical protein
MARKTTTSSGPPALTQVEWGDLMLATDTLIRLGSEPIRTTATGQAKSLAELRIRTLALDIAADIVQLAVLIMPGHLKEAAALLNSQVQPHGPGS